MSEEPIIKPSENVSATASVPDAESQAAQTVSQPAPANETVHEAEVSAGPVPEPRRHPVRKIPRIGITHGDINGIGYEVILKSFDNPMMFELCTPVIYGSAKIAAQYRKMLELPQIQHNIIAGADDAKEGVLNFINVVPEELRAEPGHSTREAGEAAVAALEAAVADLRDGALDALVTAPINKANVQSETFHFTGHTEYLESVFADPDNPAKAMMILCDDNMRIALATTHLPVREVADALSTEALAGQIAALAATLTSDFAIDTPRIAVLALNPHAGDNGLLGTEEQQVIAPAIRQAQAGRISVFGPYSADGFFGSGAYRHFDGILAMYHDQGLAPFKALCMDNGVNYTAGLPHVRTSPDHGTGYDIAGRGEASPDSMRAAIYRAIDIVRNRRRHAIITRNPLRRVYHDKSKDNVVLDLTHDEN